MKYFNLLPAFFLFLAITSCDNDNNNEGPPKDSIHSILKDTTNIDTTKGKIKIYPEEEDVKLGLSASEEKKVMPQLGLTYSELQKYIPELTTIKPDDKEKGKTTAHSTAKILMLKKTIDADFTFKNDSLVKCTYLVNELDYNLADKFYKGLQSYYSSKLGDCNETKVEEENHYNRSCNWIMEDFKADLNYDINKSIITWGMEKK